MSYCSFGKKQIKQLIFWGNTSLIVFVIGWVPHLFLALLRRSGWLFRSLSPVIFIYLFFNESWLFTCTSPVNILHYCGRAVTSCSKAVPWEGHLSWWVQLREPSHVVIVINVNCLIYYKCIFFVGDIKCENVLVTSWNWLYLSDFASFKPTYIPYDDPSDFSFFFDTGGKRLCYLAPEVGSSFPFTSLCYPTNLIICYLLAMDASYETSLSFDGTWFCLASLTRLLLVDFFCCCKSWFQVFTHLLFLIPWII